MTKRYICSFCARSFSRSEHKQRHERSHTKEKPFQCALCHHSFVRRDLLQRHCRTVHGLLLKSNIESAIATRPETPDTPLATPPEEPLVSNRTGLTEKAVVTLLTLSKKFDHLTKDLSLNNKFSNYLLAYGTVTSHLLPDHSKLGQLTASNELLYVIGSIGACELQDFEDAARLFNTAWNTMITKISTLEINYNSANFEDFIENLILMCSIVLFDFEGEQSRLNIQIDVLFEYLNNIVSQTSPKDDTSNVKNYLWFAYILLSQYSFIYNKSPSSLHLVLLEKKLPKEDGRLQEPLGLRLTKLAVAPEGQEGRLTLTDKIVICALMNELQLIKFNDAQAAAVSSRLSLSSGVFDDNRDSLHNSIIIANRSFGFSCNFFERQTDLPDALSYEKQLRFINSMVLAKRRLLLNCPLKYTDLLSRYVFVPKDEYIWVLLALTLKEFLYSIESTYGVSNKLQVDTDLAKFFPLGSGWLSSDDIGQNLYDYIRSGFTNLLVINNNLGITSLPLIFLSTVLPKNALAKQTGFLALPSNKRIFVEFVVSNFLILFRILLYYKEREDVPNGKGDLYEDAEFNEEESSMLTAILYAIKELGANVDSGLEGERGRAHSITIGEFINNKSKEPKVETMRDIVNDDLRFFFYFKNLELCFYSWLAALDIDAQELDRFTSALRACLNTLVYSKLALTEKGPGFASFKTHQPVQYAQSLRGEVSPKADVVDLKSKIVLPPLQFTK